VRKMRSVVIAHAATFEEEEAMDGRGRRKSGKMELFF